MWGDCNIITLFTSANTYMSTLYNRAKGSLPSYTIVLCLLATSYSAIFADTSAVDDTLGSTFNLGRITGNASLTNMTTITFPENTFLMADILGVRSGMDDVISFDFFLLNAIGAAKESGLLLVMFPEFDFNIAPHPAHRLKINLIPANFFFGITHGTGFGGADAPFYMLNKYKWHYLSRRGRIRLSPNLYDNAFYQRPLVNQGQVWLRTDFLHTINKDPKESELPKIINLHSRASIGIFDFLQISGDFVLNKFYEYEYSSVDPWSVGIWRESQIDSLMGTGVLTYRPGSFSAQCGYSFLDQTKDSIRTKWHMGHAGVSHILGKSIQSINQVRGNWDDYFTPLLGHKQLLAMLWGKYAFTNDGSKDNMYTLNNTIHFGLFKYCTVGERFKFEKSNYIKSSYDLAIDLVCMNIPRREYGPSHASKFEYQYGYWLEKNQVRVDLHLRIPVQRSIQYYPSPVEIWDLMAEEMSGLSSPLEYFDPQMIDSDREMNRSDPFAGILRKRDFSLRITAGLDGNTALTNAFEIRIDKFAEMDLPDPDPWDPWYYKQIPQNVLFVDNFGLSFGKKDKSRYTLMATLFGQSDKNIKRPENLAFILSGFLQYTF